MIAAARLEEIAEKITQIINNYQIEYPNYLKIYLTGRGIADMKGVRSIMSNALGRQCEMIRSVVNNDEKNKIYLSSASLMQYVVKVDKPERQSFISKLLG